MGRWFDRRVVLVGDAAHCVSLLAGEGAGLAMAGAYILAGELKKKKGELESVFQNYESILKPEILRKQTIAEKFASTFVPQSRFKIWIRNTFTNLMFLPFISKTFIDRYMSDHVQLPDYGPLDLSREPSVESMKAFQG
jgi:2-polyprenyl-6-methoxyphenol hydroxylase-like FAD-dependent oxidoreductase